jgi:hypothetical protein
MSTSSYHQAYVSAQCVPSIFSDPVLSLQFWDCPGSLHIENLNIPLTHFSTVVFVIDIQVGTKDISILQIFKDSYV